MFRRLDAREKVRDAIRRWDLFEPGERILIGVSGGIDSVALLHILLHLPQKERPSVEVAHLDHRLRGKESDNDRLLVEKICFDWKVPCWVEKASLWKTRSNLEARARELRYSFFGRIAGRRRIQKIVTAHQADDQAETFLIRWLQGAGLKGLSGIPLVRNEKGRMIVRPLLFVTRREISEYVRYFKLPFRTDATNLEETYLRNRVRKRLSRFQKENPRIAELTAMNAVFLQADQSCLDSLVEELFSRRARRGPEKIVFPLNLYQKEMPAVRYRLLQRMVREITEVGYALPAKAILKMDELLQDGSPRREYDLPASLRLKKDYVRFGLSLKVHQPPTRKRLQFMNNQVDNKASITTLPSLCDGR